MDLSISARNFELTEALEKYAQSKLEKLERFAHVITSGHLVLEKDKSVSITELTLLVKHSSINSKVTNNDLYIGISEVVKKIERQLEKYEEKFRERKRIAARKRSL
jgi:putative sigma-54 modulation protein